jgi:hypothetical protein
MKIELRQRDRRAIFLLATAIAIYGSLSYGALPAFDRLKESSSRVTEKEEQLRKYRRAVIRKGHYRDLLAEARKSVADTESRFIRGDNPTLASVELQTIVESAAKKVGLDLNQRSISPARKKDDSFNEITMTLSVESTPPQIFGFLAELRNSPKYLTIRSAQTSPSQVIMEAPKKGDFIKMIRANVTVSVLIPSPPPKNT